MNGCSETEITEDEIDKTCSTRGSDEECIGILIRKTETTYDTLVCKEQNMRI